MVSNAAADPMLSQPALQRWAAAYVGRVPTDHPLCSPLFADLKGLPPVILLYLQAGRQLVTAGVMDDETVQRRMLALLMRYRPPDSLVSGFLEAWEALDL